MAFDFGVTHYHSDPESQPHPVVASLAAAISLPRFKGVVYQMMGQPLVPLTNKEYDVYSRSKSTRNGQIGGTAWDAASMVGLTIAPQHLIGLTVGHVLKVGSELVHIEKVNRNSNTIDVSMRGYGGTTPAAHSANAAFTVHTHASLDSSLKNTEGVTEKTMRRTNFVQTFYELLDLEKGAELERRGLASYNIIPILQEEAGYRMAEMLAYTAIHGIKQQGSRPIPYATGGLLASLVDKGPNNDCPIKTYNGQNEKINEDMIHAALDQVHEYGSPDAIILSLDNSNQFKKFHGAGMDVTIDSNRADHGVGRWVDHYDYNGVSLRFIVDADMPNDQIVIATMADLKKGWLKGDELKTTIEPAPSSRESRQAIQGSLGFLVENVGYGHLLINNLVV